MNKETRIIILFGLIFLFGFSGASMFERNLIFGSFLTFTLSICFCMVLYGNIKEKEE